MARAQFDKTILGVFYTSKLRDIQFDVVWQSVGPMAHCGTSHTVSLRPNVKNFEILFFILYMEWFYGRSIRR
jgi:hypothetical protein